MNAESDKPSTAGTGALALLLFLFYVSLSRRRLRARPRNLVPIVPMALLAACGPEVTQWSRRALAVCGAVGVVVAIGAVSVSFTEDQALGAAGAAQGSSYYDIVGPAPGRASNRYRVSYLPFVTAMTRPGWAQAPGLG